jgi:hypothetical protein
MSLTNNTAYLTNTVDYIKKLQLIVYSTQHEKILVRLSKTAKWMAISDDLFIKYVLVNSKYANIMDTYDLNILWGKCFRCFDVIKKIVIDYVICTTSSVGDYEYVDYNNYMEVMNNSLYSTDTEDGSETGYKIDNTYCDRDNIGIFNDVGDDTDWDFI